MRDSKISGKYQTHSLQSNTQSSVFLYSVAFPSPRCSWFCTLPRLPTERQKSNYFRVTYSSAAGVLLLLFCKYIGKLPTSPMHIWKGRDHIMSTSGIQEPLMFRRIRSILRVFLSNSICVLTWVNCIEPGCVILRIVLFRNFMPT